MLEIGDLGSVQESVFSRRSMSVYTFQFSLVNEKDG